jgi:DNA-binding beta-propeller fold protein YncE
VNPTTNTVYAIGGDNPGSVVVIDGATNMVTTTIALPAYGNTVAVNPVTNEIYAGTGSGAGNGEVFTLEAIDQ